MVRKVKIALAFLFSYKGRIGRKSYLIFHVIAILLIVVVVLIYMATYSKKPDMREDFHLWYVLSIGIAGYCTIPVSVKRYHDLDMNFWAFLGCSWFFPILCQLGSYQAHTLGGSLFFTIGKFLWILGTFIYLCRKPSMPHENKYGAVPT